MTKIMHEVMGLMVDPDTGKAFGRKGGEVGALTMHGYYRVGALVDGKLRWRQVHQLIWEAVNGPIPAGMVVNHINGIKSDNRVQNLEVVTHSENAKHAYRVGLRSNRGSRHPGAKVDEQTIVALRERYARGECPKSLANEVGLHPKYFMRIMRRQHWRHV